ncbi:hypothetical protein LX73_0643 [Fodinibius salinus]|uniref:Uncharacterized protein n=1 Tax=Fodinibius salinus TaxID=860790 RepID=A0A5D3YQS5_9BACT|nr:hypothetical protein [Fodinibius salinus]TYP95343.1 hypothetical protein LX73_0643 [Fodinibius salinus]
MFFESDFHEIFIPAFFAVVLCMVGYYYWQGQRKNELEQAISLLKVNTFAVGLLAILLWFLLPSTPSLSSFGFPETVKEIESKEQLLNYLQEYNQAIVRITQVVYWFIFIIVWWFLAAVYSVTKVLNNQQGKEYFKTVKEKFSA